MTARTSIVIPNWNGLEHLPACLEALANQTLRDFETIVVDNASTDGSQDYLKATWPDVTLIALDANVGFPGAVNAGVNARRSEYVVLLNNDTKAAPDWLEKLVAGMDAHPEFSFGSSKLLRYDTPDIIDSAGHVYSLWLGAADNIGEETSSTRFAQRAWIFGTCAAASIYRRSLFDDIGDFDAEFFFAHEDVEFDLRANVAGHRCLLVPDAIVYHKRGASYELSAEMDMTGVRNRIWLAGKNLPPGALALWVGGKVVRVVWWVPARLLGRPPGRRVAGEREQISAASRSRAVRIRDAVAAARQAVAALPRKRRETRPIRRLTTLELLRVLRETKQPRPLTQNTAQ
jgi:GT2 family glycosyltransferase